MKGTGRVQAKLAGGCKFWWTMRRKARFAGSES